MSSLTHSQPAAQQPGGNRAPGFQRRCACGAIIGPTGECETCRRRRLSLQRSAAPNAPVDGARMPLVTRDVLQAPGRPLDPAILAAMEPRFGHDFSHVRVHTDARAAQSAEALSARAYTIGRDIVFGADEYRPGVPGGRQIIAHELAHVVQQSRGGSAPAEGHEADARAAATDVVAGRSAAVGTASRPGLARQDHPALTVPLTWDELFNRVVSDQRAFLLTRPGEANSPAADRAGVGRGVGPDRTLRGSEVIAAIQVVDRNGQRRAIGFGAHALLPGGHAEEQALAGLRSSLPADADLRGGTMMAVVDQFPCGPDRQNCGLQLRRFAEERGMSLEVRVPLRERVNQPGTMASPRTASRGVYRTDLAADPRTTTRLVTVDSVPARGGPSGPGPGGGSPGGGGSGRGPSLLGGGGMPDIVVGGGAPRPATQAEVVTNQRLIAQLESEAAESARFAGRVRVYSAAFGAVMEVLNALDAVSEAQTMLAEGTLFGDAQRRAEGLDAQSREAMTQAQALTDQISLLESLSSISQAAERSDSEALFNLGRSLSDYSSSLDGTMNDLDLLARDLDARARALRVFATHYEQMMQVPIPGAGTAPQAQAFDMYESTDRLSNTLRNAADNFASAVSLLRYYQNYTGSLAAQADRRAMVIILSQIAAAQQRAAVSGERLPITPPAPPGDRAHTTPPVIPPPNPTPRTFPTVQEQIGTVCPNCHRPAGRSQDESLFNRFRDVRFSPSGQPAATQRAPDDRSHSTPPGVPGPNSTPRAFPGAQEQQSAVCPNCHRPVGGSDPFRGLRSGSQLSNDDWRRMIEFVQGGQQR